VFYHTLPVPALGPDTMLCDDATLLLSPGSFSSYLWQDNSTLPDFVVDGSTLSLGNHTFSVWVTDANNCAAADTVNVEITDCTGAGDLTTNQPGWTVSNVNGQLQVNFGSAISGPILLHIINMQGQVVVTETMQSTFIQLDISPLAPGIYIVKSVSGEPAQAKIFVSSK
jgi:hypothetical protein